MLKIKNKILIICVFTCAIAAGCSSVQKSSETIIAEHAKFLEKDPSSRELFHVLISSECYDAAQMRSETAIQRKEDSGGDKFISSEFEKLNKINIVREGVFSIWLYPDSGRLMKIRTLQPTYITEIDELLTEDIQRWAFTFPNKRIEPTKFDIRYRVVLKKTMKDEEIIKEIQKKMIESN